MKRKLLAALGAALLGISLLTGVCAAEETEAVSETEQETEELKTIGEEEEDALEIVMSNETGKTVKEFYVKKADEEEFGENLLKEDDAVADQEKRILYISVKEEEEETETETETETEAQTGDEPGDEPGDGQEPVKYGMKLVFDDETAVELHDVECEDMEEASVKLEGEVAYLVYASLKDKEEKNTLEAEKALYEEQKAAGETDYGETYYEDTYYEDTYYDDSYYADEPSYEEPSYEEPSYEEPSYEEPSYEEPSYEEPSYEEPAPADGGENCLVGGLMN